MIVYDDYLREFSPYDGYEEEFDSLGLYEPRMPRYRDYGHDVKKKYHPIVDTIQECEAICESMTDMIKKERNVEARLRQLSLLRDCADICSLTAKFIARCSEFAKEIAVLCALICKECGEECLKYPDRASQECAKICLKCAKECKEFAGIR
jgi:hypothetical protein